MAFVVLLTLLAPTSALAGVESDDWRFGASISAFTYDETKFEGTEKIKATTLGIAPHGLLQIGKVLSPRVELGLKIGAAFEEIEQGSASFDSTTLEFLPYLALNIPVGGNHETSAFYFSPSLAVGYSGTFNDNFDINAFEIEVGAEARFFVAKDASVDIGLFVSYLSGDGKKKNFAIPLPRNFDVERFTIGPRITLSIWP